MDREIVAREVAIEATECKSALDTIQEFEITDQDLFSVAADILIDVKVKYKALDDRRKEITGPLENAKRSVNALFKPPLDSLAEAERVLKGKIGIFTALQEAKRIEIMQASAAAFKAGETPTQIIPAPAQAEGIATRLVTKFEIVDADAVPRQFCSPDETKIREFIRDGGTEAIKGVRFFQENQVIARTAK